MSKQANVYFRFGAALGVFGGMVGLSGAPLMGAISAGLGLCLMVVAEIMNAKDKS